MQISRIILPLFIIIPLIEVSLFVIAGDVFGAGPTILTIIVTAILGVHFLKQQGSKTFLSFQAKLSQQELPAQELIEGMILLVCGALLITPGFFTDIIGFLGLVPFVRKMMINRMKSRFTSEFQSTGFHSTGFQSTGFHSHYEQARGEHYRSTQTGDYSEQGTDGRIVEAEFEEATEAEIRIKHEDEKN